MFKYKRRVNWVVLTKHIWNKKERAKGFEFVYLTIKSCFGMGIVAEYIKCLSKLEFSKDAVKVVFNFALESIYNRQSHVQLLLYVWSYSSFHTVANSTLWTKSWEVGLERIKLVIRRFGKLKACLKIYFMAERYQVHGILGKLK